MGNAPPGWYDDPVGEGDERWFDGVEWAEPVRDRPVPPPSPEPDPISAPRPRPGWYQDPQVQGQERWWDGEEWHQQTLAKLPPVAPSDPPPPAPVLGPSPSRSRSGLRGAALVAGLSVVGLFLVGLAGALIDDSDDQTVTAANQSTTSQVEVQQSTTPPTVEPEPDDAMGASEADTGGISTARLDAVLEGLAGAVVVDRFAPEVLYDRDDYHPDGWKDADGDCMTTRHEVLAEESLAAVTLSVDGCRVESGEWFDAYTGDSYNEAADVSIDHVVALAAAHRAGGWVWDLETKRVFANDLDDPATLAVVGPEINNAKGDKEPDRWRPPQESAWCNYAADWITIKIRWDLSFTTAEVQSLEEMLDTCEPVDDGDYEILPIAPMATSTTTTTTPPTTSTTAPPTTTTPTTERRCDPNYSGCVPIASDVDCAGGSGNGPEYVQGPVQVIGTDIYGLDRDNDGIGCE